VVSEPNKYAYMGTSGSKYEFSQSITEQKEVDSETDSTPPLPMPFRKDSGMSKHGNRVDQCVRESQSEKDREENNTKYSTTTKNSPAKSKIFWNQDPAATMAASLTIPCSKENDKLRSKERVKTTNQKKSTKKLKLFSMH
jgi:hypothetical protein